MSLLTPDFGLLFWMTIIFGILFFLLAKFGFPVITGMVEKRSERIAESIAQAQQAEDMIANLTARQEEIIRDTRLKEGRILDEAKKAGDNIISDARARAQEEAAKVIEDGRLKIAREREDAMRELRSQVALLSLQVARKVVRHELKDDPEQKALIDALADEAGKELESSEMN